MGGSLQAKQVDYISQANLFDNELEYLFWQLVQATVGVVAQECIGAV